MFWLNIQSFFAQLHKKVGSVLGNLMNKTED